MLKICLKYAAGGPNICQNGAGGPNDIFYGTGGAAQGYEKAIRTYTVQQCTGFRAPRELPRTDGGLQELKYAKIPL